MKIKSLVIGASALVLSVAVPATTFAGFYPADRQTYTCVNTNQCEGADHVVFDSFTNNPVVGDERPFFSGSLNGAAVQDRIKVQDGDTVVLRAYVHNNADPNKTGVAGSVARNVTMKVIVPSVSQKDQNLVSFISASNATPGTINDTMSLYGDNDFTLEYVAGSTNFEHKTDGVNVVNDKISDSIVGSGASLGDMLGCFQYSGYVTLSVKVHMPSTPTPPPVTPPVTPPTTTTTVTSTTPTKLVNTGPGEVAALFAAVTAAGAIGYRFFLGRRLGNQ
jgi:hypothetical protein